MSHPEEIAALRAALPDLALDLAAGLSAVLLTYAALEAATLDAVRPAVSRPLPGTSLQLTLAIEPDA